VKRHLAGLIVTFVGAAILQVAASDTYLRFVRPGMRPLLLVAGTVLVLLAVVDVFADTKRPTGVDPDDDTGDSPGDSPVERPGEDAALAAHEAAEAGHVHLGVVDAGHSHSHHRLPRVAWLLLVPVFCLLVVDPPALGAAAAARQSPVAAKPVEAQARGLPRSGDAATPVTLTVRDYSEWAVWDKESLRHHAFRLTGFVTPGKNGTWYLTRIGITCCVADAMAYMVEIRGQRQPPKNQWLQVTGMWAEPTKHPDGAIAAIDATSLRPITAPANPYE
jgi:uncharacterized repeat protein (TIGR03943 family)